LKSQRENIKAKNEGEKIVPQICLKVVSARFALLVSFGRGAGHGFGTERSWDRTLLGQNALGIERSWDRTLLGQNALGTERSWDRTDFSILKGEDDGRIHV
jgi:hypothetical protein